MSRGVAGRRPFPPEIATYLVKLACELPDLADRSLSLWTCAELARSLIRDEVVTTISPQTVQRMLASYRLKPWRVHHWMSPKVPRDQEFRRRVLDIQDLYTRPLGPDEIVYSVDEKTSLQPRSRTSPTKPARPDLSPVRVEHEYVRKGALQLFAAFNPRTGQVLGICRHRKRQVEFLELLAELERSTPASIRLIHVLCDNVRTHHGKQVRAWLERHPRFQFHFTPVHCSWMNQVEQWFSILQRKRMTASNFEDLADLEKKVTAFITEWNQTAHPFDWSETSFTKILDKVEAELRAAA
jgi:transposase